jgi:glycosyltransferase involved in cell wall biosynthesis
MNSRPLRLLFITQKVHGQDAFGLLWARSFQRLGYDVAILCLEDRHTQGAALLGEEMTFPVYSMGKEKGRGKFLQVTAFLWYIITLPYDRVFIHMTPVWMVFGSGLWLFKRTAVYLWYTHYKMQLGVRLFMLFGKRAFCATEQSLPQYGGSPKKIVTGHGIDLQYWPRRGNLCSDPRKLLGVYRFSRSKRVELCIRAMMLLPECTLDMYGIPAEPQYVTELQNLIAHLHLEHRVQIHSTVAAKELAGLYQQHRLMLNMASETIDKTMLEAMTCGCYPVTTSRNATAIGIPVAPAVETPEAIAACITECLQRSPLYPEAMYDVVAEHHSLDRLTRTMDRYIRSGT